MPSNKNKIIIIGATIGILITLLFTPIIVAAGVTAAPVVAIHQMFEKIGEFLFGDGENENEVIILIDQYLEKKETKQEIKELYIPLKNKEKKVDIPLHWLVIPNLLAGIEEVEQKMIKTQISLIKEADNDLEKYINLLRKKEPWKEQFGNVSTSTIASYINQYTAYLGEEESLDTGNLKEHEFLYPLKEKATVTSEFGTRAPILLPDGTVTNGKHTGIDLAFNGNANTCGKPIFASMPGEVVATEKTVDQGGANWGSIKYKNIEVWYLHMRDPFPYEVGTQIKKGQFVGYIGSSGMSTGCHLHFEVHVNKKAVNPRNFLDF